MRLQDQIDKLSGKESHYDKNKLNYTRHNDFFFSAEISKWQVSPVYAKSLVGKKAKVLF